jgi:L-aminopeptidase/D-esterase-like protein
MLNVSGNQTMQGLRVGHTTLEKQGTGVTAFVFDRPAVGAYTLCGSSPASHELNTLDLEVHVNNVDGLIFTGGSAYGLGVAAGAMRWFQEQNKGWKMPHGVVPIVPAVAIYDLGIKLAEAPTAEDGYLACKNAQENNSVTGAIGAGTGASVGKVVRTAARMSGGVGFAQLQVGDVTVVAYVVVNSVGDVRDTSGKIIAGARLANGDFADCQNALLFGDFTPQTASSNSTLAAVFTDGAFSKSALKRISKMAVAGMARAITPVFTQYDGDIIFCISLGDKVAQELVVGNAAAMAVQEAIINAAQLSVVLS